ncbi:MAG: molybdopterin-binding domain of aldehyde dehydrogenase family protein [Gammaproteobacteria bacterium]|nr:molybdopterin-binding domain of aldehyde dehydrogenase family protein [Gammaproteobacteria bacterium]
MDNNETAQHISRRRFMQVSATVGGGLLLSVAVPRSGPPLQAPPVPLNAYVRIDASGRVTVVMPKVEMGQGTYTSLPMLVAEELEVALDSVAVEAAPPNPAVYGFDGDQSTGGSTTIRLCWMPLRKAGAAARMMLIAAAAKKWAVSAAACRAELGNVIHESSGRRLGYGALASMAAGVPVPSDPPLKSPKDFRLIGRSTSRRDTPDKTNGRAIFGIDIQLSGLRVALVALSPVEGGTVVEPLRADAALAIPGVRQVVNERDVVAVVGDDTWSALKGLKALDLRWNDGPNRTVQQAQLIADLEAAARRPGAIAGQVGNAATAMDRAATRVEAIYHQPFLAHATMEPMNCTVHWRKDACEFWVGTQAPDRAVAKLAELGLKPEQIQLHNQLIGGGFGRRLEVDGIVVAARIARHVEGPVKVLWRREEDIQHDRYRPYYVDRIAAGLDGHGQPVAWRHTIAGSAVTALYSGEPLKNDVDDDVVDSAADPVYAVPNLEVRFVRQEPTGVPTSWWRGVGPTRSVFVVESFVDELAAAAQQDPVKYRRALLKSPRLKAALDLAAAKAGWGSPLPAGRGRGVAVQFAFGSYLAQITEVSVGAQGRVRVDRVVCALDCGQMVNPDTIHAQLEGGVMFGLSAALFNEITFADGRVQQGNFDDFRSLRITEAPQVETYLIPSGESPGGVGETGTACAAAALCNAIYAATGKRIRTLPVSRALQT